ncbi:DUF2155 domain-containing protein [Albidovulum sp.]|uniref:DUF2155 domain-containing protein n=1 Tax=Albidovulum sp. TaxID=1872424 RepID=UPI0039B869D8
MRLALALVLALAGAGAAAEEVASAPGAVLRALDRVSGETTDLELARGATARFGRLDVTLSDCRYPVADPSANAYAHLVITDAEAGTVTFDGWMVASSPALSALDDPRYDVWVIRCRSE